MRLPVSYRNMRVTSDKKGHPQVKKKKIKQLQKITQLFMMDCTWEGINHRITEW